MNVHNNARSRATAGRKPSSIAALRNTGARTRSTARHALIALLRKIALSKGHQAASIEAQIPRLALCVCPSLAFLLSPNGPQMRVNDALDSRKLQRRSA